MTKTATTLPPVIDVVGAARVSIRGVTAWRMYREGTHPQLIEELYPIDDHWLVCRTAVRDVLRAALRPVNDGGLGGLIALHHYLETELTALPPGVRNRIAGQRLLDADEMRLVFGKITSAGNLQRIAEINAYCMTVVGTIYWRYAAMADPDILQLYPIWYRLCDMALNLSPDVQAVNS